ncbi:MAG TPA: hypothetical protein VKH15_12110 [Candidatus Acidoferrum sp.]|nr:hypothetical protein [Candidatus Acidoferrum sp.]
MTFGKSPVVDPHKFAKQFVQAVARTIEGGVNDRTEAVGKVLLEMGKGLGLYVAPDRGIKQPEFLLDFLWFRSSDHNDIALAVESELGRQKAVLDDFQKLLHIKAPLKMLIFSTTRHGSESRAVLEGVCKSYLQKFTQHVKDEEYLFIEFVDPEKAAYYHYFKVPEHGGVENPEIVDKGRIEYFPHEL